MSQAGGRHRGGESEREGTRELRGARNKGEGGGLSGGRRRRRMGGLIESDWYRCTERLKRMWCSPVMTYWTCTTCPTRFTQSAASAGVMCPPPCCLSYSTCVATENRKSVAVTFYLTSALPCQLPSPSGFDSLFCDAGERNTNKGMWKTKREVRDSR